MKKYSLIIKTNSKQSKEYNHNALLMSCFEQCDIICIKNLKNLYSINVVFNFFVEILLYKINADLLNSLLLN